MNNLLGYIKDECEINEISKNYISISKKDEEIVKHLIPEKYIAIVLGGEWKYKTYKKWNDVIDKIIYDDKKLNVVLIGSVNASRASKELLRNFPQCNFYDFVAKLSFNQTVEVIRHSEILLCSDGGLMHAANAVNANIVSLFARLTGEILLTNNSISHNLYDRYDVNNILVKDVLSKYHEAKNNLKCVLDTPELVIHEMQLEFQHTCSDAFGSAILFFFCSSIMKGFYVFILKIDFLRYY
jgi:ADP-heptose:LPS heptosyltransferase